MRSDVDHYPINTVGRDIAVGDIHGHFSKLQKALDAIEFNPEVDRLFSVGDLVDRGPESREAIKWINKPWFHAVCGNHDDYVTRYDSELLGNWPITAGRWFFALPENLQSVWAHVFDQLPLMIEVETPLGLIGIVHADCVLNDWEALKYRLKYPHGPKDKKLVRNSTMWSRRRVELKEETQVLGVRALVVGHTPFNKMKVLANVYHIDTRGWMDDGSFTLLDLHTLKPLG